VYAFIHCNNPSALRETLSDCLIRLHKTNKYPFHLKELKFNLPTTNLLRKGSALNDLQIYHSHSTSIRNDICNLITKYSDGIFASVVDKTTIKKPTWTPEELGNFVFAQTLHTNILNAPGLPTALSVIYDSGRLAKSKVGSFHSYIFKKDNYYKNMGFRTNDKNYLLDVRDMSSGIEPCLWAADFVAGAFYHKYAHNNPLCADVIMGSCKLIGDGLRLFWKK
jgi:hypothetical protein